MPSNIQNHKGFTLIEMVLSMTILLILFGLTTVAYTDLLSKSELTSATIQLQDLLSYTQSAAKYKQANANWKIKVEPNQEDPKEFVITSFLNNSQATRLVIPKSVELKISPQQSEFEFISGTMLMKQAPIEFQLSNKYGTNKITFDQYGLIVKS